MGRAMQRFERRKDGTLRVTLHPAELDLLRSIPDELRVLYEEHDPNDPGDEVHTRLFPRAYLDPTAENAEREWRELVHPELVRERLAALQVLTDSLAGAVEDGREVVRADLTDDDTGAWLGVLNDARLALGTRLGVTEGTEYDDLDPDDPATPGLAAYAWLTYLQGELIEAVLLEVPEEGLD